MKKISKNILQLIIAIIISFLGAVIIYYLKFNEIENLQNKIDKLEKQNKNLENKLNKYKIVVSDF